MRRRLLLIAVLSAMLLFCAGCGKASRTQSRTVTDMTGREIALNGDVTRVVALTAADCEILYAVGAGDALVGRGEYCDYPEAALSLPAVQSGAATNVEQIVALSPQVVFMDTMAQSVEQIAEAMGMSRANIYRRMVAATGNTPSEFIKIVRLRHAERLLMQSGLTISEICYEVGFTSPRYFSKCYKEFFGYVPSKARRSFSRE